MKKSSVVSFNSGEYVVYPTHGVGKVTNIAKQTIAGSELELLVVNFDKDKMTLRVPTAKLSQVGLYRWSDISREQSLQPRFPSGCECGYIGFACRWQCPDKINETCGRHTQNRSGAVPRTRSVRKIRYRCRCRCNDGH